MSYWEFGLYWGDDGVMLGALQMRPTTLVLMGFATAPAGVPRVRRGVIPRKEYFFSLTGELMVLPVPTVDSWIPLGEPIFFNGQVWEPALTKGERGHWRV